MEALVLLAVVVALGAAAPANADSSTIEFEPAASRATSLRALAALRMPLPPGDLLVHWARCPDGSAGCAGPEGGEVWANYRFALAHELGHIFDARVLTDRDRGETLRPNERL